MWPSVGMAGMVTVLWNSSNSSTISTGKEDSLTGARILEDDSHLGYLGLSKTIDLSGTRSLSSW